MRYGFADHGLGVDGSSVRGLILEQAALGW